MTLDNLLEEVKHGKEFVESKIDINNVQDFINEETKTLMISKRAEYFLRECDNSLSYVKKLARAVRNFKDYEDRIEEEKPISSVYARMKVDSITEDINSAILELESKRLLKESNQENIGKTIAVLRVGISEISKSKGLSLRKAKESPGLIESYSRKEKMLIESVV